MAEDLPSTTTVQSSDGQLKISLAARRSAQLPKLKDIVKNNRNRANSFDDCVRISGDPDLNFEYGDCDTLLNELAELYCYSELEEFASNATVFQQFAANRQFSPTWSQLEPSKQQAIILDLVDELELSDREKRLRAVRCFLYLLQGSFLDFPPSSDNGNNETVFNERDIVTCAMKNVVLMFEMGVFSALCCALNVELVDKSVRQQQQCADSGSSFEVKRRKSATLSDNTALRLILSSLYIIVESLRREDALVEFLPVEFERERVRSLCENFRVELGYPVRGDQPLVMVLFEMVTLFCSGTAAHYPMRKVLLLLWKTMLAWMGGWDELRRAKNEARLKTGLPACEDTLAVARTMRPAPPPPVPPLVAAAQAAAAAAYAGADQWSAMRRPPLARRQMACEGRRRGKNVNEEEGEGAADLGDLEDEEDEVMVDVSGENKQPASNEISSAASAQAKDIARPDSPIPIPGGAKKASLTVEKPRPKTLPWKPKIREQDAHCFLENIRMKFFEFKLPNDTTTTAGLPRPIKNSLDALNKHVYVSLGEVQAKREEQLNKYLFSQKEDEISLTPSEQLYRYLLPQIPQYMIALLKILLAAAPSSKAKTEAINILCDVLPADIDMSALQLSTSGSSFSLDGVAQTGQTSGAADPSANATSSASVLEPSVRTSLDINRHKEVIVKAVSSILLVLLKHLRLNHVYQFEYMAQHLVFANCIPLILKFFDQSIHQFIQSRNELAPWNYPSVVAHYSRYCCDQRAADLLESKWPQLSSERLEEKGDSDAYYMWRNLFSAINLLRTLNKLTKWKHARTMMLVVFKSAPILKRTLRIKQVLLQLYALKLLKMQAKYLGRQWRKANMEIMSAIYSKVRHRLNDDWAYGNETQSKPWDFQSEESSLRTAVERFNIRRYGTGLATSTASSTANGGGETSGWNFNDPEFQPYDSNVVSVLGVQYELTDRFKINYERWLEREVFNAKIDWDQLLAMNRGIAG